MKSVASPPPCHLTFASSLSPPRFYPQNPRFRVLCSPPHQSQSVSFFHFYLLLFPAIPSSNYSFFFLLYVFCFSSYHLSFIAQKMGITESDSRPTKYRPGILDDLFLNLFRNRMVHVSESDSSTSNYFSA